MPRRHMEALVGLRITEEMRQQLREAALIVPGCSSGAGVARKAIAEFLEKLYSNQQKP